jgi:hypothetical protein
VDPNIDINEVDHQSETPVPIKADLGRRCLSAIVTVMASEAMLETPGRQFEVFDFDDPSTASHRSVSTMVADIDIDSTETSGVEEDEAEGIFVGIYVYILYLYCLLRASPPSHPKLSTYKSTSLFFFFFTTQPPTSTAIDYQYLPLRPYLYLYLL